MTNKRWIAWFCLVIFLSIPACKAARSKEPGIRLLIQIDIEGALRQYSRFQSQQLKSVLKHRSWPYGKISIPDYRSILLTGDFSLNLSAMNDLIREYFRDWESQVSASEVRLNMKPDCEREITNQVAQETMSVIRSRLDAMGVRRSGLLRIGDDRLLLEMGALADPERVMSVLRTGGMLEFHLVEDGPLVSEADALSRYPGGVPEDLELLHADQKRMDRGYYLLQAEPVLTGRDIKKALRSKNEYGAPAISLTFKDDASRRLEQITASNIGKRMAIVFDQRIVSVPVIQDMISKDCIIQGRFTVAEVHDIVLLLQSALPASIKYLGDLTINPLLGNYDFPNGGFMFIVGFTAETTAKKLDETLRKANLKVEEIQRLGQQNRFAIFIKNKTGEEMDRGKQLATTVKNALAATGPLALFPGGSIPDWSSEKIWPSQK